MEYIEISQLYIFSQQQNNHFVINFLLLLQNSLYQYFKFIKKQLPSQLSNLLTIQNNNVRSCHTAFFLKPPVATNTECAKLCIRYSIPSLINNFQRTFIENIPSLSILTLKKKFKILTFANYTTICTDVNCYLCIHKFFSYSGFDGCLKYMHIFYYMINFDFFKQHLRTGMIKYIYILSYIENNI